MNSRFASTAVDQTRADYCSTAWLNKLLPSAPLRTVPLFTASRPDVRQRDTHFAGYKALFIHGVTELGCLAHARRKFFDLHAANANPMALEALNRIAALYAIDYSLLRWTALSRYATDGGLPIDNTPSHVPPCQNAWLHDGYRFSFGNPPLADHGRLIPDFF